MAQNLKTYDHELEHSVNKALTTGHCQEPIETAVPPPKQDDVRVPFTKSQHIATVLSDTYGGKRVARRLRLCARPTIGSRPRYTGKKKMLLPSRSSRQVLHEATHLKVATPRNIHNAPLYPRRSSSSLCCYTVRGACLCTFFQLKSASAPGLRLGVAL